LYRNIIMSDNTAPTLSNTNIGNTTNLSTPPQDTTAPTLTTISIASNNSLKTNYAGENDVVTLTLVADETLSTVNVTFKSGGQPVTNAVSYSGAGTSWNAQYTVSSSDTNGIVSFAITIEDSMFNSTTHLDSSTTTDSSSVTKVDSYVGSTTVQTTANTQKGDTIFGMDAYSYLGEFSDAIAINENGNIVIESEARGETNGSSNGQCRIWKYDSSTSTWAQLGQSIVPEGTSSNDEFESVDINASGDIVAIGSSGNSEISNRNGHVRVWKYSTPGVVGGTWEQLGQDIDGGGYFDKAGESVALNNDGTIVAVGYLGRTINSKKGCVRVFQYSTPGVLGGDWEKIGQDVEGTNFDDKIGTEEISLSGDGLTFAVGATENIGYAQVWSYNNSTELWEQVGDNFTGSGYFGNSLSLSNDGSILAIADMNNDGNGTDSGLVRVWKRDTSAASGWSQLGSDIYGLQNEHFGSSISLSRNDGSVLAIGAKEGGINYSSSDPNYNQYWKAGYIRIYQYSGTPGEVGGEWNQIGDNIWGEKVTDPTYNVNCYFGTSVRLSYDGAIVCGSAYFATEDSGTASGHMKVYETGLPTTIEQSIIKIPPDVTSLTISSSNSSSQGAKVADEITLSFEYDLSVNTPMVSFQSNGVNVADTSIDIVGTNNTIWTAKYTVDAADQEGTVTFSIDASAIDTQGVKTNTESDITNGSSVTISNTAPTISSTSINSDNTELTVIFSEDVFTNSDGTGDLTASDFSIGITGGTAVVSSIDSVTKTSNSEYVLNLTYSVLASGAETIIVTPSISTSIYDIAGNAMSTTQANNTATLNQTRLAHSSASISSNNTLNSSFATYYTNDIVTLTIVSEENIGAATISVKSGGVSVNNSLSITSSGNTHTAQYVVSSSDTTGIITFTVDLLGLQIVGTTDRSRVEVVGIQNLIDPNTSATSEGPSIFISNVSISSNNTTSSSVATSDGNNEITLSITALYDITQPTVTFQTGGVDISGNVTVNGSGKDYTASFTADRFDNFGDVTFSITNYEHNSVAGGEIIFTTDGSKVKLVGKRFAETTRASVANTQLGGDFIGIDNEDEKLGKGVAINGDGSIIAMSSPGNDEVNSSQGKVDVFEYDYVNASWNIMGSSIRPIHFGIPDTWSFGNYRSSISLDENGTTLAMFAESTSDTTVYIVIVKYDGTVWTQLGSTITLSKTVGENMNLKLNSFGHHLIVGLESNNSAYVYRYNGYYWFQLGNTITSENTYSELQFGYSVAINSTGNRILVGSNPTGSYTSNYSNIIYEYRASQWVKAHEFSLKNQGSDNGWGCSVDMSSDGNTISIGGAYSPDSWPNYSTDQSTGDPVYSTGVIILQYDGSSWNQLGNKITSTNDSSWGFGTTHSLSKDGTVILVGEPDAEDESSNSNVGRSYVYQYDGSSTWNQVGTTYIGKGHVQSDNVQLAKYLGLSADGTTMMVGASGYDITGSTSDDHGLVQVFETGCGNKTIFDKIDNIIPEFNTLTLSSNATYSQYAGTGNTITLSMVTDVSVNSPTVSFTTGGNDISGNITITGSETTWIASFVVDASDTLGVVGFSAQVTSLDNIEGLILNTTTDNTGVTIVLGAEVNAYNVTATGSNTQLGVDIDGATWANTGDNLTIDKDFAINEDGSILLIPFSGSHTNGNGAGRLTVEKYTTAGVAGGEWVELGQDILGSGASDALGVHVAISSDGSIISATADEHNGNGDESGLMRIYKYSNSDMTTGGTWTQIGQDIVGSAAGTQWGRYSCLMSNDGNKVIFSSVPNSGNGNLQDSSLAGIAHMRLYQYSNSDMTAGGTWEQLGDTYTDSNGGVFYYCDSSANTVSYRYDDAGSYVSKMLTYSSGTWTQKGQDISSVSDGAKLSNDGNSILVFDSSYDSWRGKAQVYEYDSDNNLWVQKGNDILGQNQSYYMQSMTMNSDGNVISIGAMFNTTGDAQSGETRVYQYYSPTNEWVQIGDTYIGEAAGDKANWVEISGDGKVVGIVAEENDDNGDDAGHLRTFLTGYPATITSNIYTELSIPPTITSLTIASNNTENTKYAGENDVVTLNIVADVSMNEPTVSFTSGGLAVTGGVTYTGSDTSWTAQYTVNSADTLGSVAFTVDTQSVALLGNTSGVQATSTTDSSEMTILTLVSVTQTNSVTTTTGLQLGDTIVGETGSDYSGFSVSLSDDGTIVAIGSYMNDGNGEDSGHVRVYQYDASKTSEDANQNNATFGPAGWNRLGDDIDGGAAGDNTGISVSLNSDGTILAVGTQIAGYTRVYQYSNLSWTQIGNNIVGSSSEKTFGRSVSLSSDGTIIAIGDSYSYSYAGSLSVYQYSNSSWTQLGDDIVGENAGDLAGISCSLSNDGTIVAFGEYYNDDNGDPRAGQVRVFQYDANKTTADVNQNSATFGPAGWNRLGDDLEGKRSDDRSGISISLNGDGTIVAIGASYNDDNGDQSGHTRVYQYSNSTWTQIGIDIVGAAGNYSGKSVSLNNDGTVLAIGSGGGERIYKYSDSNWTQIGSDITANNNAGISISLSSDGTIVAIGASTGNSDSGFVRIHETGETKLVTTISDVATIPPTITFLTIASNNTDNTKLAVATEIITLIIVTDININQPTVTFTSGSAAITNAGAITYTGSDNSWTAQYTVDAADTVGEIGFTVDYSSVSTSTSGSQATSSTNESVVNVVASVPPAVSTLTISSNNSVKTTVAVVDDVVTLALVTDININQPTVSFTSGGVAVTGAITYTGSDNSWTAQYTVNSGDTAGEIGFTVDYSSASSSTSGPQVTSATDGKSVNVILPTGIVNQIPPELTNLSVSTTHSNSSLAVTNDMITINLETDVSLSQIPSFQLKSGGIDLSGNVEIIGSDFNWVANYIVEEEATNGAFTFVIDVSGTEYADNQFTQANITSGSSVSIVTSPIPSISSVSVSNNNNARITFSEDVYTTSAGAGDLQVNDFELTILTGYATLSSSTPLAITKNSGTEYDLSFSAVVGDGHSDILVGVANDSSIFNLNGLPLDAGYASNNIVVLGDNFISNLSLSSNSIYNSKYAQPGDIVNLDIKALKSILQPTVVFKSDNESVNNSVVYTGSDVSWNASYTVHTNDTSGNVTFTINYTDLESNSGIESSSTTDNTGVTIVPDIFQIAPEVVGLTHTYTQSANNSSQGKNYVSTGDSYIIYAEFRETLGSLPVIDISIGGNSIAQSGYIMDTLTQYTNPVAEQYNGSNDKQYRWNFDIEQYMGDGDITYTIDVSYSYITVTHTNDEITDSSVFTSVRNGPIYESVVDVGLNGMRVTFNKDVFTESDGTGDLVINTFEFAQYGNSGTLYLNSLYPTSVTKVTNSVYDLSYDMVGELENNTSAFLVAVFKRTAALIYDASGLLFTTPYKGSAFLYDSTVVSLTSVSIASDNSSKTMFASYYTNDTVTLSFTSSESLYETPVVSFTAGGADISGNVTVSGSGTAWTASYLVDQVDTLGLVGFTIDFTDGYNSQQVTVTTDNSKVTTVGTTTTSVQTVPAIPPVISSLGILSNNTLSTSHATDTNTITVSMTYDENLTQSPTVTFQSGGLDVALSTTISGSDATYTASYVVDPNDTQGDVTFVIDASGTLADSNDTQLEITDGSSMEMLDSPPTFSSVTNEINKNISIEFSTDVYNTNTASGDLETSDFVLAVESGDVTLTSTTPSAISKVSNKIYDLSFSLTETVTTNVPIVSINPVDSTSIYNSVGFAMIAPQTTDNSFNLIDRLPPSLTSVSIVSNNTYKTKYASYFAPDTVTLTLTASENINQPVVTFTVDDVPVTDTINYSGSGASWTVSFVVTSSTPLGNLSFSIDYTDTTDGNAGTTVTSTTDATNMIIVGVNQGYVLYPPDATAVTVDSNGAHGTSVGVGETVSISIDFDDVVYDLSNISILIGDVSINNPFTITPDPPATSFTISFVISESDPSGNITFSMDASGALGVNTITHNLITDGSSMETDFTLPVFTGSVSTSTQLNNFDPTYLQGFLDISGAGIRMQNDSKLFIGGDVSLAGNMFIDSTNSVKINTTENNAGYSLEVAGNTDLSGNVTIAGDIDVSGNVVGIVNYNTINKDIPPISNSAIDYSDSTDETALPVGIKVMTNDNSFNNTTATIHNDLSANGNFGSTFIFDNSLSVAGSVLVSDLSENSYGAYTIYSKKDSTDSFMVGKSASNVFTIVNQSNVGVFMNSDSNVLTSTSDKNLKTNISNLENNSDNIMKLRPVEFNWNYEADNKKKHVGFIAQEVEEIFPELVEENVYPNGEVYKGVNTNKLIPYMIDEIKLLEEKLEKLEKIK
jgi:hypothetical protein